MDPRWGPGPPSKAKDSIMQAAMRSIPIKMF